MYCKPCKLILKILIYKAKQNRQKIASTKCLTEYIIYNISICFLFDVLASIFDQNLVTNITEYNLELVYQFVRYQEINERQNNHIRGDIDFFLLVDDAVVDDLSNIFVLKRSENKRKDRDMEVSKHTSIQHVRVDDVGFDVMFFTFEF